MSAAAPDQAAPPSLGFSPGQGRPRPSYTPRKVGCPKCGDQLAIKDETSRLAVCPACGSHIELSLAKAKVLRSASASTGLAEVFQLRIGDRFTYRKVRYEVIGRLRLDEPETLDPTCNYLLFHPRHGPRWLSEYAGHWDLSETSRVMPRTDPRELSKGQSLRTHDGASWLLAGRGTYQITWVDGALPWVAEVGDRIEYAELVAADGSGETYEVEYPQTGGQEIETGRGSLLTVAQVRRATDTPIATPAGPRENVFEITKTFGSMRNAAVLFMLVNLVLLVAFAMQGRQVLDQTFSSQTLAGEVLSDPFPLAAGSAVKVKLHAPLDNAWMAVDLGLVRDDTEPAVVHVTDSDLEYYSGREGGESWSEGSKSSRLHLRVDEAGTYRLLVRAVSARGDTPTSTTSHVRLRVRVYAGVKRAVWMVLALLASTVALVMVFAHHLQWSTADDEDEDDD